MRPVLARLAKVFRMPESGPLFTEAEGAALAAMQRAALTGVLTAGRTPAIRNDAIPEADRDALAAADPFVSTHLQSIADPAFEPRWALERMLAATRRTGLFSLEGAAGTGKTTLVAELVRKLRQNGWTDAFGGKKGSGKTFCVAAPTHRAASILRANGIRAVTIQRACMEVRLSKLHSDVVAWLEKVSRGAMAAPPAKFAEAVSPDGLQEAIAVIRKNPGDSEAAIAASRVDFYDLFADGWTTREEVIDLIVVDEASMVDEEALGHIRKVATCVLLVGDDLQLPPVNRGSSALSFVDPANAVRLVQVRRQKDGSSVVAAAHAIFASEDLDDWLARCRAIGGEIRFAPEFDPAIMADSPALVFMNKTRAALILAWRAAMGHPVDQLRKGEPLIVHGRSDRAPKGFTKGEFMRLAEAPRRGSRRVSVVDADGHTMTVEAAVADDAPGIPVWVDGWSGIVFRHGAASTIHSAQGGQWPIVQISIPDLRAAERMGRGDDAGSWRRLAYVAVTRATGRVILVEHNRLSAMRAERTLVAARASSRTLLKKPG